MNLAYDDYYQRMVETGGEPGLLLGATRIGYSAAGRRSTRFRSDNMKSGRVAGQTSRASSIRGTSRWMTSRASR